MSVFTTKPPLDDDVLACLQNANCSYLSSGVPPTLLQLKQHAQSLTVLIKELTISTNQALVDNANSDFDVAMPFRADESFD
jgi:hypothetical protein